MVFTPNGPITRNSIVSIGTWYLDTKSNTSDLYLLSKVSNQSTFRFEKVVIIDNGKLKVDSKAIRNVLTFKVSGTQTEVIFEERRPKSGRFLGSTTVGNLNLASESMDSDKIIPSQSKYQNWTGSDILLSGVLYQLKNSKGNLEYNLDTGNNIIQEAFPVFIFPITVYFGCTSTSGKKISKLEPTAEIVFCNLTSDQEQLQACQNAGANISTWTNSSDCHVGRLYDYCPTGRSCDPTCKSPCTNKIEGKFEDCEWHPDTSQYQCTFNTRKWWNNPLIVGLIIVGAIILVFFILRILFKVLPYLL